jgi:hypothetical protein
VAGFALMAVGALLAGAGTALVWTTVGMRQDAQGLLDLEFRGLDLAEGIATLGVAGATLVALLILPRLGGRARVGVTVGLLVAGGILVALPSSVALRAEEKAIEEIAEVVADAGALPIAEATDLVRTDPDLAVRTETYGVWPSVVGGALVLVGAGATLAQGRRPTSTEP